ncbi:hypothetical protein K6U51_12700 [Vibrio fluvialis]|uniref:hypothetical protein n=1 Tax=Vibrio fluvialis TaxID=676 RepID=UPI001EEB7FF3|nr:hypothetical protein [Vibrio fluvialis]MCG6387549.1 hypothetical protein [Vibrio fluvialis]MCG6418891.1 hypothetical protein [Vibrio fluvialis]
MSSYAPRDALECTAVAITYQGLDLSSYYKKGHLYEVLKVDDGVVYILDAEGYDYAFSQEDVNQFFKQTSFQFPITHATH